MSWIYLSELVGLFEVVGLLHVVVANQVGGDLGQPGPDLIQGVVGQGDPGQLQGQALVLRSRLTSYGFDHTEKADLWHGSDDLPVLPGHPGSRHCHLGVLAPPLYVHVGAAFLRVRSAGKDDVGHGGAHIAVVTCRGGGSGVKLNRVF